MDKSSLTKLVPGIYSTSLVDVDLNNVTTMYHPLKKETSPNELTVDSLTPYYYRSRANSNIIQRRFSTVEQPTPTVTIQPVGKTITVHMSFKHLFSLHSHGGHHHSRRPHSESSDGVRRSILVRTINDTTNLNPDEKNEQLDSVETISVQSATPAYANEEQYRTRRRSVQFLDKKFIQFAATPHIAPDDDSSSATNASEDVCEFYLAYFLSTISPSIIMPLNALERKKKSKE
ncbi:unnamed protein product [Rotaria socialis]|uniref:Uncharacterized protein n=2 Tax=Rotaria socialis TaxID=392032 RepID=A0A820MIV4_9BILA|nr:unnamed protein product [Rotaria socialis]CAF4110823.1 unnamed protein product [Rotaria socialis]CAF4374913.1 unnamed protein product [Rotaria socialis]CAF4602703.1 unnamed protein product [Rotaria socialis]